MAKIEVQFMTTTGLIVLGELTEVYATPQGRYSKVKFGKDLLDVPVAALNIKNPSTKLDEAMTIRRSIHAKGRVLRNLRIIANQPLPRHKQPKFDLLADNALESYEATVELFDEKVTKLKPLERALLTA